MDLSPYIESVRTGVANASSLADEHTQRIAERLGAALESSTRLALIEALSDAASTISAELAPSSVELRMSGVEPEFAVTVHGTDQEPMLLLPESPPESASTDDAEGEVGDEPVARVSLRLPQSVKSKVDDRASAEGISTNAWLIRVVMDALVDDSGRGGWWPPRRPVPPDAPGAFFGPNGPFGQHGVFGPNGPFGQGGRAGRSDRPQDDERRSRGNVRGWVR